MTNEKLPPVCQSLTRTIASGFGTGLSPISGTVGTVLGVELMGIRNLFASSVPLGSGFIESRHGRIPVPAPATLALLKGVPVYDAGIDGELVTPTGAALLKGLVSAFGRMPPMTIAQVGYGVGRKTLRDRPNLLRIMIGREHSEEKVETVVVLEANLDDTHPEWTGFLMDRLFSAGALDVVFAPIQMKKNRPGTLIQIMARPHMRDALMDILFQESTTLGVRFRYNQRKILPRSIIELDSPWGKLKAKKVIQPDGNACLVPEYEACRQIAERHDLPIKEVYSWVTAMNPPPKLEP